MRRKRRSAGTSDRGNDRAACAFFPFTRRTGRRSARLHINYKLQVVSLDCAIASREDRNLFLDLIVCGDFNVAPEDRDVHDPAFGAAPSCVLRENAPLFARSNKSGLRDTLRIHHAEGGLFSWWDYRMLAFPKNRGLRIDAILASESLAERCIAAGIDREMRKGKDPSDHAPVWAEFSPLSS